MADPLARLQAAWSDRYRVEHELGADGRETRSSPTGCMN